MTDQFTRLQEDIEQLKKDHHQNLTRRITSGVWENGLVSLAYWQL